MQNDSLSTRALPLQDPQRPGYHFLPPANWMNDPNGLIEWGGRFHMFYQYNPHGPFHGTIHWGHAVSSDLLHWEHLPIALAPTPGGPDAEGCWSGCAVNDRGAARFIYTGVSPQTVCIASGDQDLIHWRKHPHNPVIASAPVEISSRNGGHFRDPSVWWEEGAWYMLIGSRIEGEGGILLLYRSPDLFEWQYLHTFLSGDVDSPHVALSGTMWECPMLLKMAQNKRLVIYSTQSASDDLLHAVYVYGELEAWHFKPGQSGVLVHGDSYYAPQVMRLADGRQVIWGWLRETRGQQACDQAGWSGAMSLPCEVVLWEDGVVGLKPVDELTRLRKEYRSASNLELDQGEARRLKTSQGDRLELQAEFLPGQGSEWHIAVRCSPDEQEVTRIHFSNQAGRVVVDRQRSSLSPHADRSQVSAPFESEPGKLIHVHIFIDRSILEIFIDHGRTNLATRIYPQRLDSLGAKLQCTRGRLEVRSLETWDLSLE